MKNMLSAKLIVQFIETYRISINTSVKYAQYILKRFFLLLTWNKFFFVRFSRGEMQHHIWNGIVLDVMLLIRQPH